MSDMETNIFYDIIHKNTNVGDKEPITELSVDGKIRNDQLDMASSFNDFLSISDQIWQKRYLRYL